MNYKTIVYTPMFDELTRFFRRVDEIIQLLKKHKVDAIEMCFGWSWGEWDSFATTVDDVMREIRKQEEKTGDRFGRNDVSITIKEFDMEMVFCHESDLHISFNAKNALVTDIIDLWRKDGIIHAVRQNDEFVAEEKWLDLF